jgi:hypothetical protein
MITPTPLRASAAGRPGAVAVAGLLLALALIGSPGAAEAQYSEVPAPAAYALEDVTVVQADGSRQAGVTVVVRDGLVETLEPGAPVPDDAKLLEGDSLFVYPGFVDAAGELEVAFPEIDTDRSEVTSWNPPRPVAGFQPHLQAAHHLELEEGDLESLRKQGVIAAAIHPDGAVMPGQSAFVLFRTDASEARDVVLDPVVGSVLAFSGARAYPSTLFAMIAFMRQAFLDAGHRGGVQQAYASGPSGMSVPRWDPDYEVLRRMAGGGLRTYFRANNARDIRHALDLADQFDLRMAIVGGEEAWRVADRLASSDVPVLVSLDFPTPERWDPEEAEESGETEEPETGAEAGDAQEGAEEQEAEEQEAVEQEAEELEPQVLREKERIEDVYRNAGRLVEAGVTVALTSGDGGAELREGARKAIEYGLSENVALQALTTTPASLFGRTSLTRIEPGMAANFQVTSAPVFDEDAEVRYVFVDGRLQVGAEPGAEPEEPPATDVTGTWEVTIETGQGSFEGTSTMEQSDEGTVTGTFTAEMGEMQIRNGVVSGHDISFTLVVDAGGEQMELSLTGTVEGDEISGSGSGPFGSFTWEAERTGGGPGGDR